MLAVFTLNGCCETFATLQHEARKDHVEAERFFWSFRDAATRLQQNGAEPKPIYEECLHDFTLDIEELNTKSEADAVSFVQFNIQLLDF